MDYSHILKQHDWQRIFDALPFPVYILNNDFSLYFSNKASTQLHKQVNGHIFSLPCYKSETAKGNIPNVCPFRSKGASQQTITHTVFIEELNKQYHITCSPLFDDAGNIDKIIHVATDISEVQDIKKKAEEHELQYQKLFENHISGFALHKIVCDDSGKAIDYIFLEANPAFEVITGMAVSSIIGKRVTEVFPNTEEYWIQNYGNVALTGTPFSFENYSKSMDKYFQVHAYCPKPGHFAVVFNDITENQKNIKKIKEQEDRLHAIISQAPDAIYLADFEGAIITVNQKACDQTGYTHEELLQLTIMDIDGNFNSKDQVLQIRDAIPSEGSITIQSIHKRKDDTEFPVEIRIALLYINEQQHIIGFVQDITQRKQHQQKILLHNSQLESLYAISQYPIQDTASFLDYVLNEVIKLTESTIGYIYYYNEETELFTLNSWSKEVLNDCMVVEKQTTYELAKTGIWGEVVRQRKPIIINDFTAPNPHKKGYPQGHVTLNSFASAPIFIDSKIVAAVGVANKKTDYTQTDIMHMQIVMDSAWKIVERQRLFEELIIAKEQAEENNALKTAFLANISHEIRTPMNAILGFSDLLIADEQSNEEREYFISIIKQSGKQLLRVINDIIDIAKISAHAIKPDMRLCDIFYIVSNSVEIVKQQQYSKLQKNVSIHIQEGFSNIQIQSDPVRLQQIFTNLISNAVKYTLQGTIEIGTIPYTDDYICIYVKDTGIGIPKEFHDKIFELFRQVNANQTIEGTGIGLNITQGLIQLLGGTIWVESEEGKGSTFYVTIPNKRVEQQLDVSPQSTKTTIPDWSAKTICIAEDNIHAFTLLEILLAPTHATLLHAANGKELLALCVSHTIDVILLDIHMPVMNGSEALKELKAQGNTIPIIAQTAYTLPEDIEYFYELGCKAHISKPIQKNTLFTLLAQYL